MRFEIWSDTEKQGELLLSRGAIDWVPESARTRYAMGWEKLDDTMQKNATPALR